MISYNNVFEYTVLATWSISDCTKRLFNEYYSEIFFWIKITKLDTFCSTGKLELGNSWVGHRIYVHVR